MITHTLIYSFPPAMTEQDRKQFSDEHAPVFAATDVAQIAFADLDAVAAASALPALRDLIARWQARFSYKLVWANHEPAL